MDPFISTLYDQIRWQKQQLAKLFKENTILRAELHRRDQMVEIFDGILNSSDTKAQELFSLIKDLSNNENVIKKIQCISPFIISKPQPLDSPFAQMSIENKAV